jgi:hypothetical protein
LYFKPLDEVDAALPEMIEESFILGMKAYALQQLRAML